MSANDKKADFPERWYWHDETNAEESPFTGVWSGSPEIKYKGTVIVTYLSLQEHQSLLTAAEEKLRIAREALETAPMLIDDDYVTTESPDGEKENWVNHGALKRHVDEALAKLGGADERS